MTETPKSSPESPSEKLRERAIKFPNEDAFNSAIDFLEDLEQKEPIKYTLASEYAILAPHYVIERLIELLDLEEIAYTEANVTNISELPIEEQARIRGQR